MKIRRSRASNALKLNFADIEQVASGLDSHDEEYVALRMGLILPKIERHLRFQRQQLQIYKDADGGSLLKVQDEMEMRVAQFKTWFYGSFCKRKNTWSFGRILDCRVHPDCAYPPKVAKLLDMMMELLPNKLVLQVKRFWPIDLRGDDTRFALSVTHGSYRRNAENISAENPNVAFQFQMSARCAFGLGVRSAVIDGPGVYSGDHFDAICLLGFAGGILCRPAGEVEAVVRLWSAFESEQNFQQIASPRSKTTSSKNHGDCLIL